MTTITFRQQLDAWYKATRPRVFTATYVPLALAGVIALQQGVFDLVPFLLALLGALFLQTAANLVNEYADYRRGADTYKVAGQGMTIKNKILSPRSVFIGAVATLLAGALIGLLLLANSGPLLLWIGLVGVIGAVVYTAGPFPLSYNGLGEFAAGVMFGPLMVLGAYYVMARAYDPLPVIASLPVAFMVAAILHANNIRDIDADRAINKRTLVVMMGLQFARAEYAFLVFGTYVLAVLLVILGVYPWLTLLALLTLPEANRLVRIVYEQEDVTLLHQAQGRTARLHGRFGLLLVAGWLLALLLQALV
ncbi:MAG: 1,4-dihydroxy-2-naphthoate octaprenyltransferase [Anaerolineae bacterium]|nr:1,4-dihydroxy-2-naphthoate octaprenyltransferase [Anaerolineae bacterium]